MRRIERNAVLAYRLAVNHLAGSRADSLQAAARSGLQDGSPRSALLSLAARAECVGPNDWRAPGLAQVFGPRGAIYVVAAQDVGVFTRGLLPRDPGQLARLEAEAASIHAVLGGEPLRQADVVAALPDLGGSRQLRWAASVGTLVPVWDTVDTIVHPVASPAIEPEEARSELARRFLRFYGPATVKELQWWLDGLRSDAVATVKRLGDELAAVSVDGEERLVTASTLQQLEGSPDPDHLMLLPPDDVYINRLAGRLLLPDPAHRKLLWPSAPPPGALVIGGEVCGTWRRRGGSVTVTTWREIPKRHRQRTEAIVAGWPLREDEQAALSWIDAD